MGELLILVSLGPKYQYQKPIYCFSQGRGGLGTWIKKNPRDLPPHHRILELCMQIGPSRTLTTHREIKKKTISFWNKNETQQEEAASKSSVNNERKKLSKQMKAFFLKSKARQRDQRASKAAINTQNGAWTRAEHSSIRFQPPIKSLGWGKDIFYLILVKNIS